MIGRKVFYKEYDAYDSDEIRRKRKECIAELIERIDVWAKENFPIRIINIEWDHHLGRWTEELPWWEQAIVFYEK